MENNWTSFTLKIGIKAHLETLYKAWANATEIEKWFFETCLYQHTDDSGNAVSGSPYEWSWYLYPVKEKGKVVQANGKDFFQFSFAGDCLVDVHLKEFGENILVTLTQHRIPDDEPSKFAIRIGCLEGWTFYLANLKSYYETGYDLRNKYHPELKGVNN